MAFKMLGHHESFDFIASPSSGIVNTLNVTYSSPLIYNQSTDIVAKLCKDHFITFSSVPVKR